MMTGQPHPQAALTHQAQAHLQPHLVDLEGLLADLELHFDLVEQVPWGDPTKKEFRAPFSW